MSPSPSSPSESSLRGELARIANPFASYVASLDSARFDVPAVHREAFLACMKAIRDTARSESSGHLLIFGEPGCGKTHLLGRLHDHLEREQMSGYPVLFVPVYMQTSPAVIWRYLRRHVADALLRRGPDETRPLDRLLGKARAHDLHRDLGITLDLLLRGERVRDSAAWLRGDALPESVLDAMGLGFADEDESLEEQSAEVIGALAKLAAPAPFIFCFDQLEATQSHPGDNEGIHAFANMAARLHNALSNAVLLSCVQTSFLTPLEKLPAPLRDRFMRDQAPLNPLTWDEAREVVAARLDREPVLRDRSDPLWPLAESKLRPLFDKGGRCLARRVLFECKQLFDEVQGRLAEPAEPPAKVLGRLYEERRSAPPGSGDFILRNGLPLLIHLTGARVENAKPRENGVNLTARTATRATHVAIVNQTHANAVASQLKKLTRLANPENLVIVREARLGLGPKSDKLRRDLMKQGARYAAVSEEAIAALNAIRKLLAEAESGDLSYRGESIPAATVEEWIGKQFPPELDDLRSKLADGAEAAGPNLLPRLLDYLDRAMVAPLEDAARELQVTKEELADCARQNPDQVVLVEGRRAAVFAARGAAGETGTAGGGAA